MHRKSVPSQEVRALLAARKQMQIKAMDLKQTLHGLLRGFGLKVRTADRFLAADSLVSRQALSPHPYHFLLSYKNMHPPATPGGYTTNQQIIWQQPRPR